MSRITGHRSRQSEQRGARSSGADRQPPFHPSGPSRTFMRGGPEGSQWSPDFDIVALPRE
ncbi:hypothetical protein ALC53_02900 [Atta colombica]|uniref:Uncharacterized protein n=1 Tax=Atta colombica TaxID=520822 RepID=A0A195BPH3_9HYME|nr:hypothetical protein ALC53_02900 [Atta colombica]